jgi:hypothetical protein
MQTDWPVNRQLLSHRSRVQLTLLPPECLQTAITRSGQVGGPDPAFWKGTGGRGRLTGSSSTPISGLLLWLGEQITISFFTSQVLGIHDRQPVDAAQPDPDADAAPVDALDHSEDPLNPPARQERPPRRPHPDHALAGLHGLHSVLRDPNPRASRRRARRSPGSRSPGRGARRCRGARWCTLAKPRKHDTRSTWHNIRMLFALHWLHFNYTYSSKAPVGPLQDE